MPKAERSAGLVFLLPLLLSAGACTDWKDADSFRSELRCGLSTQETRAIAIRYGVGLDCSLPTPGKYPLDCTVRERNDIFWMEFSAEEMLLYRVNRLRVYGLTGIKAFPPEELCAPGERPPDALPPEPDTSD